MDRLRFKLKNNQQGQILILSVVVVGIVLLNTLALIGGSLVYSESTDYSITSQQALELAEAGIDKGFNSINSSGGSYTGQGETFIGPGSYTITVSSINSTTKQIASTGYVPSQAKPKSTRTVIIQASVGTGVAFNYGVQVGDGGLSMSNGSLINGSVYSNGNITMSNNSQITGDAYVAGGIAPAADQQSDCTSCSDFLFGKNVNGSNIYDVAQSFQPSNGLSSYVINKVSLKLKKFANPSDLTVRLLANNQTTQLPDTKTVLTSGTLTANLVTTSYSFVDVVFNPPVTLSANTTYWILVDTSGDSTNYWSWSADVLQSYTSGKPVWTQDWTAKNPTWTAPPDDLGFKTWMGGTATSIIGSGSSGNESLIGGQAHSNTLSNLNITKSAYYQTQSNITVAGSSCTNNPNCYPNSQDPVAQVLPISDANITDWKNQAQAGGTYNGDITTCPSSIPVEKINGNVNLPNNCVVTVNSPIWVTGMFTLNNNDSLKLNSSYGASSGVIVIDGQVTVVNNNTLTGSGTSGSFLVLLSTYDTKDDPLKNPAINLTNGGNTGVMYSNLGSISIANNNNLNEVTGWQLNLSPNVTITYSQGLAGMFFSSGPSGSYALIKGTYQQK